MWLHIIHKKQITQVYTNSTLNMRLSCSTHSATRFWWVAILRLFMIRTSAASIANLLSLLTSSMTFFFSSEGGSGTCKTHQCQVSVKTTKQLNQCSLNYKLHLYPPHPISKFMVELEDVFWGNCSVIWLFVENLVLSTWDCMKHACSIIFRKI
jgi:hypothetical protein